MAKYTFNQFGRSFNYPNARYDVRKDGKYVGFIWRTDGGWRGYTNDGKELQTTESSRTAMADALMAQFNERHVPLELGPRSRAYEDAKPTDRSRPRGGKGGKMPKSGRPRIRN